MKFFLLTFIITFSLLLGSYYTYESYQATQLEQKIPEKAGAEQQTQIASAASDFISPEKRRQKLREEADVLVDRINKGQAVNHRLPVPFPVPSIMEMFFMLADEDIRNDVIRRVDDPRAKEQLQAIANRIYRTAIPDDKGRRQKIAFDMTQLDADGLQGPPDGKVTLSYEFSIPDDEISRNQVAQIDKTVQFMPGSRGRVGAGPGQCLCIGSTGQKNFREVLLKLASLPYISRIIVCDFE